MKSLLLLRAAILASSVFLAANASAKTLVYCSEASPETFTPMIGTADSTMDAAAKTIFNRLVEFKPGSTEIGPALGRELGRFARWQGLHLPSAPWG